MSLFAAAEEKKKKKKLNLEVSTGSPYVSTIWQHVDPCIFLENISYFVKFTSFAS